jgi:hypothetical protein
VRRSECGVIRAGSGGSPAASSVAHQKLPGKGHRVSGSSIDFHLGRGDRDVEKALREIDSAIASTNAKYEAAQTLLEQRAGYPAARAEAAIEKLTPLCESWWASRGRPSGDPPPGQLPAGAA